MGKAKRTRRAKLPPVAPIVRVIAVVLAFALALYGFWQAYAQLGKSEPSLAQLAFRSIRLIVGNFPAELENRDLPLSLHIARWALPLLTFWSTIALAWAQLRNPVRLYILRARGDHIVATGDDGLAKRIARAALEEERRVLVWAADSRVPWVQDLVDQGAAEVQQNDADDSIDQLGLDKAQSVLLLGPDDAANITLAAQVIETAEKVRPSGDPLPVIARVDNISLRRSIESRFERIDRKTARVRFASVPDIAARQLFVERPIDAFVRVGNARRSLFVFGLSLTSEQYLMRVLAAGHFRDGGKPELVIIDAAATEKEAAFRARYPGADTLSPVVFVQAARDQAAFAASMIDSLTERFGLPVGIVVDLDDDAATLALALAIDANVVRADWVAPPIAMRIEGSFDTRLGGMIVPFGQIEALSDPELLLQEKHDVLARSIHDFYLEGRLSDGEKIGARASMEEWENLPESFRDDNRLVADCYQLKLRDIGARLLPGKGPALRLEPDELEALSRAEHDRWMAAKLTSGWVYGPQRNDAARIHPDIVPYDDLEERIKDLDREQVRIMTRMLAASGQRALRLLRIGIAPGSARELGAGLTSLRAALATHYPDREVAFVGDFADADTRALFHALEGINRHQIVVTRSVEVVLHGMGASDRGAAAALAHTADTIFALDANADTAAYLANDCDMLITSSDAAAGPAPLICFGAGGTIKAAPWIR